MNRQNVKQIIQELARQNYNLYSDGFSYNPKGGALTQEEKGIAEAVAKGFWDNRTEDEIERDETLEITSEDYRHWVVESVEETARGKAELENE
jgi:6-pyruvoyl-tetrahydropterin synthase